MTKESAAPELESEAFLSFLDMFAASPQEDTASPSLKPLHSTKTSEEENSLTGIFLTMQNLPLSAAESAPATLGAASEASNYSLADKQTILIDGSNPPRKIPLLPPQMFTPNSIPAEMASAGISQELSFEPLSTPTLPNTTQTVTGFSASGINPSVIRPSPSVAAATMASESVLKNPPSFTDTPSLPAERELPQLGAMPPSTSSAPDFHARQTSAEASQAAASESQSVRMNSLAFPVQNSSVNSPASPLSVNPAARKMSDDSLAAAFQENQEPIPEKVTEETKLSGDGVVETFRPLASPHLSYAPPVRETATFPSELTLPVKHSPLSDSTDFADKLGAHVTWLAEQRIGTAEIRLLPDTLGSLDIRLEFDGQQLHAHFHSANPEVRMAIETEMPRLREQLAEHGLHLAQGNVGNQTNREQHTPPAPFLSTYRANSDSDPEPLATPASKKHVGLESAHLLNEYA